MLAKNVRVHTGDVAPADRVDVWRQRVSRALYPLNSYPLPDSPIPFHADYRGIRGKNALAALGAISPVRTEVQRSDIEGADPNRVQLFVPLSGGGVHTDRHGSVEVKPGSYFLTSAEQARTYLRSTVSTSAMIEVDSRCLSLSRPQLRELSFRPIASPAPLLRLMRDSVRNLVAAAPGDAESADALLIATTDLLLRSTVGVEMDRQVDAGVRLEQVRQYLASHLADASLTSESLAAALSISRRALFALFEETASTPMALLASMRVEQAKVLLAPETASSGSTPTPTPTPTSIALPEIAARCGFSGPDQFYRVFRRHTGLSPARYREAQPVTR